MRAGSWMGPPRGKRAPRIGISSTVFGVRAYPPRRARPGPGPHTSPRLLLQSQPRGKTQNIKDTPLSVNGSSSIVKMQCPRNLSKIRRKVTCNNCVVVFKEFEQLLHRNVQRFRGGLVFKAHRLCVSLKSRFESNTEEEEFETSPLDLQ